MDCTVSGADARAQTYRPLVAVPPIHFESCIDETSQSRPDSIAWVAAYARTS
jgi:hypothetical protein